MKILPITFVFGLILILASCNAYFNQPMAPSPATQGEQTIGTKSLTSLPAPEEPAVVAVYKFRDQTGQYKASDYGSSWSTAVTQGATSILLKALEESNWFVPIEREGLANLLNERKIVRSSRMNYEQATGIQEPPLPPLLFAGVILEGGIISYDHNILTGGAGARYLGISANGEYREDRISIYLRAISTNSGRILKTIYTSKTILSQQIQAGIFKYVKPSKLLEAETGFTYNEPTDMAVKEAIEKAVQDLILEGVIDGLWNLKNPEDIEMDVFTTHIAEKEKTSSQNIWGNKLEDRRDNYSIGAGVEGLLLESDYGSSTLTAAGELTFNKYAKNGIFYSLSTGYGKVKSSSYFEEQFFRANLKAGTYFFPKRRFSPYAAIGGGLIYTDKGLPILQGALGAEVLLKQNTGLFIEANSNYFINDKLDGINQGDYNDFFVGLKVGLNIYLDLRKK